MYSVYIMCTHIDTRILRLTLGLSKALSKQQMDDRGDRYVVAYVAATLPSCSH
jgi:hypothetical protein